MQVVDTVNDMRRIGRTLRKDGKSVALAPTMGALHRGHIRLIEKAKEVSDVVVVSSFVNPRQFTEEQDFHSYPRTPERDREICEKAGADYFFFPQVNDMYPHGFLTTVNVSYLSEKFEGEFRPGHFRGVCTVVMKLFNIVQPAYALFGMKDAQQYTIIQHMIEDLCLDIKLIGVPTARDRDGLALSSRNALLTAEDREMALSMNRALKRVHFLVKQQGILHSGELMQAIRSHVNTSGAKLEYAAIVNRLTLEPLDHVVRGGTFVMLAIRVGKVRLIDNTRI